MKEFSEFKILNHLPTIERILKGENPPPVTVEVDPTNACNHRCIWCIDAHHRDSRPDMLDIDVLLASLSDMARMGVRSIVLKGGGEPLTYPHIDRVLLAIRDLGMQVGIITNGELIDRHLETLAQTVEWLRISVDAGTASTHEAIHRPRRAGAFAQILANIEAISKQVYTGVIQVVHPRNFHEMALLGEMAKKAGARYIAYRKVLGPDRETFPPEMLMAVDSSYVYAKKALEDERFKVIGFRIYDFNRNGRAPGYTMCKAHGLVGIVCADGDIYACCSTRGNPEYRFGSLYEESFEAVWNGTRRMAILARIDGGDCRHICAGKTTYMRYDHYNRLAEYLQDGEKPHGNFL